MNPIRLLHIGDIHLGEKTYDRFNDFVSSLDKALEISIEKDVEIVIFSGDIFATPHPLPAETEIIYQAIKKLINKGIQALLLIGNHDSPARAEKGHILKPLKVLDLPGVKIIDKVEQFSITCKNGAVEFVSLPYPTLAHLFDLYPKLAKLEPEKIHRIASRAFIAKLRRLVQNTNKENPLIFLAHIFIYGAEGYQVFKGAIGTKEIIFSRELINTIPFTYGALGHIHRFQDLNYGGASPLVYAGSIERISFNEEDEKKGVVFVELKKTNGNWQAKYEFIPIKTRAFRTIYVDIRDKSSPINEIKNAAATTNIKDAIVRLFVRLRKGEEKGIDPKELRSIFSPAYYFRCKFEYDEPLRKETKLELDWTSPIAALEKFIDQNPEYKIQKAALLRLAEELQRKLEEDEK